MKSPADRPLLRTIACIIAVSLAAAFAPGAWGQASEPDFTVIFIPDPQKYAIGTADATAMYNSMMQWIVDHRASNNILAVIGAGDLVDNGTSATQWATALAAWNIVDAAGIPIVPAIGNHDYDAPGGAVAPGRSSKSYFAAFGPDTETTRSWYGGSMRDQTGNDTDLPNFWIKFGNGTSNYGVLALEFCPRAAAVTWGASVLDSNPDRQFLVVTHDFLFTTPRRHTSTDPANCPWYVAPAQGGDGDGTAGEDLWNNMLRARSRVIAVLSGHLTPRQTGVGKDSVALTDVGDDNNVVAQIYADFQDEVGGGNGYLLLLHFLPSAGLIEVTTFSPYCSLYPSAAGCATGPYKNDADNHYVLPLNSPLARVAVASLRTVNISDLRAVRMWFGPDDPANTAPLGGVTDTVGAVGQWKTAGGTTYGRMYKGANFYWTDNARWDGAGWKRDDLTKFSFAFFMHQGGANFQFRWAMPRNSTTITWTQPLLIGPAKVTIGDPGVLNWPVNAASYQVFGAPLSSAHLADTVALARRGADLNPADQVVSTHLTSALAPAQGGTGVGDHTYSGSTHRAASVNGATMPGHCAQWDAAGNLIDNPNCGVYATFQGFCRGIASSAATANTLFALGTTLLGCDTAFTTGDGAAAVPSDGHLRNLACTATAPGSSPGSGKFSVQLNGAVYPTQCTLGTATRCVDSAFALPAKAGDRIAVVFTTGPAETLANISCTLVLGP